MNKKFLKLLFTIILGSITFSSVVAANEIYELDRNHPLATDFGINVNFGHFRSATKSYKGHDGIDYRTTDENRNTRQSVFPITGGRVSTGEDSGWGKYVVVTSSKGGKTFQTRYAHLSKILVNDGDKVKSTDPIGISGNTGSSTAPHLHFSFGPMINGNNELNPIVHGLKQGRYGDPRIEGQIIFFDENLGRKVNLSTTLRPLKIIVEAYHYANYPTNPYKIEFIVTKTGDSSYKKQKTIEFDDLSFTLEDYYRLTQPYRTYYNSTDGDYKNFFYTDWTPDTSGTYEVEVKAYVAYWENGTLVFPSVSTKRQIYITDALYDAIDPEGMYAWEPPARTAASGVTALVSWPQPRYVADLSNAIFTTNTTDISPDFQKYTEFTVAATRNTDWTVRIKNASSGAELKTLTASGQETVIKWDGAGMGSGKYKYEIEARDPTVTSIVSTKEGIFLITIDNDKPDLLTNWATAFPTKTSITASDEYTSIHFAPQEDLYSVGVNIVDATNHENKIITGLGWSPNLKQNETFTVSWDGAGHYPDGTYQFEVVMTDLAGNINKVYSNPFVINVSGSYVSPIPIPTPENPPPPPEGWKVSFDGSEKGAGIAIDANGFIYMTSPAANKIMKFDNNGNFVKSWAVFNGSPLLSPEGIAVSPSGDRIYVTDTYNKRLLIYSGDFRGIKMIQGSDVYEYHKEQKGTYRYLFFFTEEKDWSGDYRTDYGYHWVSDVKIDADGNVFVVDCDDHRILKYDKDGNPKYFDVIKLDLLDKINFVTYRDVFQRLGWSGTEWHSFWFKSNQINDLFIIDNKFPDTQTPIAWHANSGNLGNKDGQLAFPVSMAVDLFGNLYIADTGNHRIQKFAPDGSFVAKFGSEGSGSGQFKSPQGVFVDEDNHIWVADTGNQRIVQFNALGEFVREYKSDEYAINPQKIKVKDGKLYIADANFNKPLVWNIGGDLANVRTSSPWFSPSGNSTKGPLKISYNLSQPADVTIQLIPKTEPGITTLGVVGGIVLDKTSRNIGNNQEVWDGKLLSTTAMSTSSTSEIAIPDGQYTLKIAAAFGDYVKTKTIDINIDNTKPSLALNRDPPGISPNSDGIKDSLKIDYSLSDNLSPTAEVKLYLWKNGRILDVLLDRNRTLDKQTGTSPVPTFELSDQLNWNGKIGSYVIEGNYTLEARVADLAGNISTATAEVLVDFQPPRIYKGTEASRDQGIEGEIYGS